MKTTLVKYTLEKKVDPGGHQEVWEPILQNLLEEFTPYNPEIWLCACTCGPNSRITHHQKLWKAIKYNAPIERRTNEISQNTTEGDVCYYGAVPLSTKDIPLAPVGPSSRAFLAIFFKGETPNITELAATEWLHGLHNLNEVKSLAIEITRQGGILVRLFGEYDEREAGVDLIMEESTAIKLLK